MRPGLGQARIGIGSANRYDLGNPFTAEETAGMIRLVLAGRRNFELIPVPGSADTGDAVCLRRETVLEALNLLEAVAGEF